MKAIQLNHAAAGEDHRHRRDRQRVHVEQRQRRDQALDAGAQRTQAAFVHIALADREHVIIRQQATLRCASGA